MQAQFDRRCADCRLTLHTRPGSTLLIVMVLLGMLSLLGLVFFTFASQERASAIYFADGAKTPAVTQAIDPNELADLALSQLIAGGSYSNGQSMLWGNRHSLVANSLGLGPWNGFYPGSSGDFSLHSGEGLTVNPTLDPDGSFSVAPIDFDNDGVSDPWIDAYRPLQFADSPAAPPSVGTNVVRDLRRFPQPDVDYNAPDINSLFLSYTGYVRAPGGSRDTFFRVVIPSFHRPQYARDPSSLLGSPLPSATLAPAYLSLSGPVSVPAAPVTGGVLDNYGNGSGSQWYDYPGFGKRSMRPHPEHVVVGNDNQGNPVPTTVSRYLSQAQANAFISAGLLPPGTFGFPFRPMSELYGSASTPDTGMWYQDDSRVFSSTFGTQGVWSPDLLTVPPGTTGDSDPLASTNAGQYAYDYDNDGDGIREGILIDLGADSQLDANGARFVPLFSITVQDLDGLVNLNHHGNIAGITNSPVTVPEDGSVISGAVIGSASGSGGYAFGTDNLDNIAPLTKLLSRSNMGLGPAEVSPQWVLNARPGTALDESSTSPADFSQHQRFYGSAPTNSPINVADPLYQTASSLWKEASNMEWFWLTTGRPNLDSSSALQGVVAGRNGEASLISSNWSSRDINQLPRPGSSFTDDNADLSEGENPFKQYRQPMDFTGLGVFQNAVRTRQVVDLKNRFWHSSPNRWQLYWSYSSNQPNPVWFPPTLPISGAYYPESARLAPIGEVLMVRRRSNALIDDPYESAFQPTDGRTVDAPFPSSEMAYLTSSDSTIAKNGFSSRAASLASFNLKAGQNLRSESIRRKTTTLSVDREEFSFPRSSISRTWEWNDDTGLSVNLPTTSSGLKFPPVFGPSGSVIARGTASDPFRTELRAILQQFATTRDPNRIQRKLSLNQLLTTVSGQLAYRDLSPHQANASANFVDSNEQLARSDRQNMARDVFSLLYTFGLGDDLAAGMSPTNNLLTAAPPSAMRVREIAQFAVNLVDFIDTDSVITQFNYDDNLSDGWNPSPTNLVYGVEAQQLAFNEGLLVKANANAAGTNHADTAWQDPMSGNSEFFVHLELRNNAPFEVPLTPVDVNGSAVTMANSDQGVWRIRVADDSEAYTFYRQTTDLLRPRNAPGINAATAPMAMGPGRLFTVASSTLGGQTYGSDIRIDYDRTTNNPGTPVRISPLDFQTNVPDGVPLPYPQDRNVLNNSAAAADATTANLDINNTDDQRFLKSRSGSGTAPLITSANAPTGAGASKRFLLERRMNPLQPKLSVIDNPWVVVDQTSLEMKVFTPPASGTRITSTDLDAFASTERKESLDRASETSPGASQITYTNTDGSVATFKNSIGLVHGRYTTGAGTIGPFGLSLPGPNYIQHHLDRDLASPGEMLLMMVCEPHHVTIGARQKYSSPYLELQNNAANDETVPLVDGGSDLRRANAKIYSAAAKFLVPEGNSSISGSQNRWHRLLSLVEVPTRVNKNLGLGTAFINRRVPGKINLNMVRHPEVLAALLDDERQFNMDMTTASDVSYDTPGQVGTAWNQAPQIIDRTEGARNWWEAFQGGRDTSNDPFFGTSGSGKFLPLPGLPGSHPFRSPARLVPVGSGLSADGTLARSLVYDSGTDRRHLFEVGTQADHTGGSIDPLIRHRFLSKTMNNVTTRSNAFAVFITVKFFRAVADPANNGAIRIAEPLNKKYEAEHRGMFIVDRSKLEKAYNPATGQFDFRAFIDFRQIFK